MPSDNPSDFNPNIIRAKTKRAEEKRGRLSGGIAADMKGVQGSGPENRHGLPRIPIGQHEVPNWPVLDLGVQPEISLTEWSLTVKGDVSNSFSLNWKEFKALEQTEDVSDFHCVTTWSRLDNRWAGVKFNTIAELAKPNLSAKFV
ncbi:MAG: molybdopterin-dependent oxidoreductase, partial [Candidatus Omnitrophica bacterium]|nr:molybdopterin-dependent oxidoreductase [Candidatus Omnitrophota bacterium]